MRWGRTRDERGAIFPMVAMLLAVLIPSGALAVDLGMQRVVRRDMQVLADLAALNLARNIDGRTAGVIKADPAWADSLAEAIAGNRNLGDAPTVDVELGTYTVATSPPTFTPVGDGEIPIAVRVSAQSAVDFAFAPESRGGALRTSIAIPAWVPPTQYGCVTNCRTGTYRPAACFSVGSYAARVRNELAASATGHASGSARVGNLAATFSMLASISTSYTSGLSLLSYEGLADATVSLGELASALRLGSPSALATTTVSRGDYFAAVASVLADNGNTTDAAVLQTLAANLASAGTINLGSLVALDRGAGGLDGTINVFDQVVASALLMNGGSFLAIPGLSASLPAGLGAVSSQLRLVQGPQLACARPNATPTVEARTSQLSATVNTSLGSQASAIASVVTALTLTDATVQSQTGQTISTALDLASGTGRLTRYDCETAASPEVGYTVTTNSGLLTSVTTAPLRITAQIGAPPLALTTATINVTYTVTVSPATSTESSVSIDVPPRAYDTPYSSGSSSFPVPTVTTSYTINSTNVAGLNVGLFTNAAINQIVNAVGSVTLTPLVTSLNQNVAAPLADLVGARVGGVDVLAHEHLKDTCNTPIIVG